MASTTIDVHLGKVLRALAIRVQDARDSGKEARLGVAVGVIGDLGQFMTTASPTEVRTVQAKIAGVREKLRFGDAVHNQPTTILDHDKNNEMFLSGALWAADEFLEAQLRAAKATADGTKTSQRGALRDVIVRRLGSAGTATPKDCIDEARKHGLDIRPDQVSRALGDLLREGTVEATDAPHDGDRRNRYFRIAPSVATAIVDDSVPASSTATSSN